MTELSYLPGYRPPSVFDDLSDRGDPRDMIPILQGIVQGLFAGRLMPGDAFEPPMGKHPWLIIVDDRAAPGASGPRSFDADTLRWLFADACHVVVDSADEPSMPVYELLVEWAMRKCILVIHTIESRRGVWREFSRQNCEHYEMIFELPVRNNPEREAVSFTRFDR